MFETGLVGLNWASMMPDRCSFFNLAGLYLTREKISRTCARMMVYMLLYSIYFFFLFTRYELLNTIILTWNNILYINFAYMRFVQPKFRNLFTYMLIYSIYFLFFYSIWVMKYHHFNIEQYIPNSLICDLFSRNLETYLHISNLYSIYLFFYSIWVIKYHNFNM